MALSAKNLAGPGYIILNILRGMNILGLLAAIAACVVMLVKTSTDSRFFFFEAVSNVITAFVGGFLLLSELPWFPHFFERNWPLLSLRHGFVTLATGMIALGIVLLGDLNKPTTNQKSLGLALWRVVIGGGIVIFVLGWLNLIANFVFRDRKAHINARQVRLHGAVAAQKTPRTSSGTPTASELAASYVSPQKSGGSLQSFRSRTSPRDKDYDLPSYHNTSRHASPVYTPNPPYGRKNSDAEAPDSPTSRYSRVTACTKKAVGSMYGMVRNGRQSVAPPLPINPQQQHLQGAREPEISGPLNTNPQFAHLTRPDSAMHPSRSGESEAFRWRTH